MISVALGAQPLLSACGSDGSSAAGAPGASGPKLSELPATLAETLCDVTAACFGPIAEISLAGRSCLDVQLEALQQGSFSVLQGAVDAHRVTYDGSKVASCVAAIKKENCGLFANRLGTVCDGVFTGTVASGGDCTLDEECKKDLFCEVGSVCPGKCATLLSAGGACKTSDNCKDGLICSAASSTCMRAGAEGDPCNGTSGTECPAHLVCVGDTATNAGSCVTYKSLFAATEGDACDPTSSVFCKPDLRCALSGVDASGAAEWKCEKPATSPACHLAYPDTCPSGQFCEIVTAGSLAGTCTALPGDGDACAGTSAADPTKDKCAPTALCVQGTCRAIQHLGGACASDDQCVGKLCKGGKCVAGECAAPETKK